MSVSEAMVERNEAEARRWRNLVLAIVATLLALGIVMIDSASSLEAGESGDSLTYLRRQVVWAIIAAGALLVTWHTDYHALGRASPFLIALAIALLAAVLIPGIGTEVNGARRWIRLPGIGFQPSEMAKVALILFVAHACALRGEGGAWTSGTLPAVGAIGTCVALILLEPDFGTAVFVTATSGAVLLVAGIRLTLLLPLGLAGGLAGGVYVATHLGHVRDRLAVFLHPGMDPLGKGYQVRQSLLALGSGGVAGEGLGESRQKLFFLPLQHSDFIFAVIGEELGLIGALLVIALFAALLLCGARIIRAAPDPLGLHLAFGFAFLIGLQAALNIAVVTAALPTKGIPLPFISSGGSSLVVSMMCVGVLLNVASQGRYVAPVTRGPGPEPAGRRA